MSKFNLDLKIEAQYLSGNEGIKSIAKSLGINHEILRMWIKQAFKRLSNEDKLLLHSDQGWHYQIKQYRQALTGQAITKSVSRKGNCYDNAVME